MDIVVTSEELQKLIEGCKSNGKTIGFVPTMGAYIQAIYLWFVRLTKAQISLL